jgi:tRNA1Val (adenine37-N6)-methyltransferase
MAGGNSFEFKQFKVFQDKCAMKVGTDAVLIGSWANYQNPGLILDIGTGTGVIALMLAQKFPDARVDAIDIDANASIQAKENVASSPWSNRVHVVEKSLQEFNPGVQYDLIVSNPPYFINSFKAPESSRTQARQSDHLPYEDLVAGVKQFLKPKGSFFLILPFNEANIFIEQAEKKGIYLNRLTRVKTRKDKTIDKRLMMQFGFERRSFNEMLLIIETDERGSYSEEYRELTKDFYKNF